MTDRAEMARMVLKLALGRLGMVLGAGVGIETAGSADAGTKTVVQLGQKDRRGY